MIRTDWFDGHEKPARPGVYEREFNGAVYFVKWNGEHWSETWWTADEAEHNPFHIGQWQCLRWRGIVPEVHGCVPVEERAPKKCNGCAFWPGSEQCQQSVAAIDCWRESIIWRPRAEVAP